MGTMQRALGLLGLALLLITAAPSAPAARADAPPVSPQQLDEAWVARYTNPASLYEYVVDNAVDGQGNLYVLGASYSGREYDFITIKYSAAGQQLWFKRYDSPSNGNDGPYAIGVDSGGNVYVTGSSDQWETGTCADWLTIKYDPSGNEVWVARYNGPGNGCDSARDLVIDAQDNVYVTGRANWGDPGWHDFTTVKYSPQGAVQWTAHYNGTASGYDSATAIALDTQGNVYITGYSYGVVSQTGETPSSPPPEDRQEPMGAQTPLPPRLPYGTPPPLLGQEGPDASPQGPGVGPASVPPLPPPPLPPPPQPPGGISTRSDYATVKYDSAGQQLWAARYNGPANGYDYARALAVDGAGRVFVTGSSWGGDSRNDYATVAYDSAGVQLWATRYNGPGNQYDNAYALAADGDGGAYVTGSSYGGSTTDDDWATIRYDALGNEAWVARYNGPGNHNDSAYALAVDGAGNLYVTGRARANWGSPSYDDATTVKYDPQGNVLWVAHYGAVNNRYDSSTELALGPQGTLYISGGSYGATGTLDFASVKYDAAGQQLWAAHYENTLRGYDRLADLVVDGAGNTYVTGASWGGHTGTDYLTVKYDAAGNQAWAVRFDGEKAQALAVDGQGNVYVTGYRWGPWPDYYDYYTVKYDSVGNLLWVVNYDSPAAYADDYATAIAVDTLGNVYVTGQSLNKYPQQGGTYYDYATVKYDANGNQLWVARYNGPSNDYDVAQAIAVDANGNVYVTGYSEGNCYDYATVKYDANGNQLWASRYDGGNCTDQAYALALDTAGNVYVTGQSWGNRYDYATVKYDSAGAQQWVARYDGPGNRDDGGYALGVDASGNVYVSGFSWDSASQHDAATVKYDSAGNQVWVSRYNGPGNGWDWAYDLVVHDHGKVYIAGASQGAGTDLDYLFVEYNATTGAEEFVGRYNGPGNGRDIATSLAVDQAGNAYVGGSSFGGESGWDYATVKYKAVVPTAKIGSTTVGAGGAATVPVSLLHIPPGPGVGAYTFKLCYDPAVVHVLDVLGGDAPFDAPPTSNIDNGVGCAQWASLQSNIPGPTGDFEVAQVVLQGVGAGGATSNLDLQVLQLVDSAGDPIAAVDEDGVVTIVSIQALIGLDKTVIGAFNPFSVLLIKILDTVDPGSGLHFDVSNGIGSYTAQLTYSSAEIKVQDVVGVPSIDPTWGDPLAEAINNAGGITTFTDLQLDATNQAPDTVAGVYLHIIACTNQLVTITLAFTQILDGDTNPIPVADTASKTFRRGDAKPNGVVDMADALYIAQAVAGTRAFGQLTGQVHPINAATVKEDLGGDKVTAGDFQQIAQRSVGLRNDCFNLITGATPPVR